MPDHQLAPFDLPDPGFAFLRKRYGESMRAACRSVGSHVGMIAAGVKPSGLPIAQPTVFEFVINLKTAKALGIAVPRDLLLSANSVIE